MGLIHLEGAYVLEIAKLVECVDSKANTLLQSVRTHQHETNSTVLQNARNLKEKLQKRMRQIEVIITEKTKERWQRKRMRGQFPRSLDEKLVDNGNIVSMAKIWGHQGRSRKYNCGSSRPSS
jgi:hypothetical protein